MYEGWLYHVRMKHDFTVVFVQELNIMYMYMYTILTESTVVVCTVSVYLSWNCVSFDSIIWFLPWLVVGWNWPQENLCKQHSLISEGFCG